MGRRWYSEREQNEHHRRADRDQGCTCWNLPAGVHAPGCVLYSPAADVPISDRTTSENGDGAIGSAPPPTGTGGSRETVGEGADSRQLRPSPAGDRLEIERIVGHVLSEEDWRRIQFEREEDHAAERHKYTVLVRPVGISDEDWQAWLAREKEAGR